MLGESGFGRYELVERLAVRSASELFVVRVSGEHGFRRQIVLKRLRDDAHAPAFIDDAKLSAKLSHAKIVQTLELGRVGEAPYVATEYVDGVDLLGLLNELARQQRRLDRDLAVWIAQELLDALDYAHTFVDDGVPHEVVHGRLSPSKVLIGVGGEVKVCDFGVARRFDVVRGGHDYGHLSPEQVMELPVGPRSDIFSAGILLAEMLIGRRLFAAPNEFDVLLAVRDVNLARFDGANIDPELVGIVKKALEKRPEERWQSAAELRDALDAWSFAQRASNRQQRLAALVAELRVPIDLWRRGGAQVTRAFDDLADAAEPMPVVGASVTRDLPRAVSIPAKVPKGTSGMRPLDKPAGDERTPARGTIEPAKVARGSTAMPPLEKPADDDRHAARGTVDPPNTPDLAQGTERAPATAETKPAKQPRPPTDPMPPSLRQREPRAAESPWKPAPKMPHPRLLARGEYTAKTREMEVDLVDLLPARAPTSERPTSPPVPPEQLAEAGEPSPPTLTRLDRHPDDGGDFARTSPLRVLFHLIRTRATGLLSVSVDTVRKDVYMRDGRLAGVWSNDRGDLFGSYLVQQHVLSEGELSMALATMSYYGGKIGDTLVGLGLLRRVEVFRHLTRHARAKAVDLCTWMRGRYAWYAGKEDPREAFPMEGEPFMLLGEGALAMPASVIDAWLAKHRSDRLAVVKTQRVSPEVFGVRDGLLLFGAVDGVRTLGAVVDRHGDRAHAARVVYLFVACDLVRAT